MSSASTSRSLLGASTMPSPFEEAVHDVIASLQPGDVLSYGEVAVEAGYPNAARAVGVYLRNHGGGLPWWRVVAAGGRIISRCAEDQVRHLTEEGHLVERRRVRPPS